MAMAKKDVSKIPKKMIIKIQDVAPEAVSTLHEAIETDPVLRLPKEIKGHVLPAECAKPYVRILRTMFSKGERTYLVELEIIIKQFFIAGGMSVALLTPMRVLTKIFSILSWGNTLFPSHEEVILAG